MSFAHGPSAAARRVMRPRRLGIGRDVGKGPAANHSPRRRRIALALASVTLPAGLLALSAGPAAAVLPTDGSASFASYNTQGSDNGARWTTELGPLAQLFPIVAVQEAGSGPPQQPHQADPPLYHRVNRPAGLPQTVEHTQWRFNGVNRDVYFLQTDPQRDGQTQTDRFDGGRVNLAMITERAARDVRVLENPFYDPQRAGNHYRARPLLGLMFGNTWYYDIHGRGYDGPDMLQMVRGAARAGQNWVVAGDWNINIRNLTNTEARAALHLQPGELLIRSGRATHANNSELDYAVVFGTPPFRATVPRGGGSDHFPVEFTPLPVAPPVQPLVPAQAYTTVLASATSGQHVDLTAAGAVVLHAARNNDNQRYRLLVGAALTHAFQNVRTDQCLGLAPFARLPRATDYHVAIVPAPCNQMRTRWTAEDPLAPGGPLVWRSADDPELCLTAPPPNGRAFATLCDEGNADQRWWNTATNLPESQWTTTDVKVRLASAASGNYLDVQRGRTADNSAVIAFPRKNVTNQTWNIEAAAVGDNLVRLRPGNATGKCLDVLNSNQTVVTGQSVIFRCNDPSSQNDGTGHRWLAENYADGTVRFRNEATHLCLTAPANQGQVTVEPCNDTLQQRWYVQR